MGAKDNNRFLGESEPKFQGFLASRRQIKARRLVKRTLNTALTVGKPDPEVTPGVVTRSTPLFAVIIILAVCGASGVYSLINPAGDVSGNELIIDRETYQMYLNNAATDTLYPVYNLSSARLILGHSATPKPTAHTNIIGHTIAHKVGIPNAPDIPVTQTQAAQSSARLCQNYAPSTRTDTVVFVNGRVDDPGSADELSGNHAMVFTHGPDLWFVTSEGRSLLDTSQATLVAVGITGYELSRAAPISESVFNALPELAPLATPLIPRFGEPAQQRVAGLPDPPAIGTVFLTDWRGDHQHFLVLDTGVQPIPPMVADMIRNQNSFGMSTPPAIPETTLAQLHIVSPYTFDHYPATPPEILSADAFPALCYTWVYHPGDTSPQFTISAGRTLPNHPGDLASNPSHDPGGGYVDHYMTASEPVSYVYAVPDTGHPPSTGPTWWINEAGQRYEIPQRTNTADILGITLRPLPMPSGILNALPPGVPPDQSLTPRRASRTYPAK